MFRTTVDLVTLVDQTGTVYSADAIHTGRISKIRYVPDGTNPLATGADLTITEESTGQAILAITNIGTVAAEWSPRPALHDAAGAAALYAAAGQPVLDPKGAPIFRSRIKVVIAQGGATAASRGTLYVWVD